MRHHNIHLTLCVIILVLVAGSLITGCVTATRSTTAGVVDTSTGAHILTGVESIGTPMVFEGMQSTVFGNIENPQKVLVVTHGDSGRADYMLSLAQEWANIEDGLVTVVLARPGCTVEQRQSPGRHIRSQGDYHTDGNISMMENALVAIRNYFQPTEMRMLGHSGGAIVTSLIIGRGTDLLDGVILVSHVGDINTWLRHCFDTNRNPRYSSDFNDWRWRRSLSPNDYVNNIREDVDIVVISGGADTNTTPELARSYVDTVTRSGRHAEFVIVEGAGHNRVLRTVQVNAIVNAMIQSTSDTMMAEEGDGFDESTRPVSALPAPEE